MSFTLLYTFCDTIPYDTQCNDQIFHYNHINWNWWNEVHRKLKSSDHWITKVFRLSDLLCHLKFYQCLNRILIGIVSIWRKNTFLFFTYNNFLEKFHILTRLTNHFYQWKQVPSTKFKWAIMEIQISFRFWVQCI